MTFESFWKDFFFFTNPVVRYSGIPTTLDFSFPIFRARVCEGFELTRENLQYPPKKDCKKTGRANVPYYPVFYGSYSKEGALKEINTEKQCVVSIWKWKEEFDIRVKLLSTKKQEFEAALKSCNISITEDYQKKLIAKHGDPAPGSMISQMLESMDNVANLFLNEDDYFGSAIIGFEELYRTRLSKQISPTDVLIYPSVKSNKEINLAIHPDIVDRYLNFVSHEIIY